MRFGYWMPVFGGWLRNVRDEGMTVAWPYIRDLVTESERHGFEVALIAEVNLTDIKGPPRAVTRLLGPCPRGRRGNGEARADACRPAGLPLPGLVGTPEQITDRLRAYEQAGGGLVLLQMSPQRAEMARFGRDVISRYPGHDTG